MKPAGIRNVALLAIFLLTTAVAWTSLLEAREARVSNSRLLISALLFEKQGRVAKAVEMYRQVLQADPGHRAAASRLAKLTEDAEAVLLAARSQPTSSVGPVTPVEADKPLDATEARVASPPRASVGKKLSQTAQSLRSRVPGLYC